MPEGCYVHASILSNQLLLIFPRNQSSFIGKNYGGFSFIDGFLIPKNCSNLEAFLLFGPQCFSTLRNLSLNQFGQCFMWYIYFFLSSLWNNLLLPSSMTKAAHLSHPSAQVNPNTAQMTCISNQCAGSSDLESFMMVTTAFASPCISHYQQKCF